MKELFILRGLPGSGKSEVAAKFKGLFGAVVCSADDYRTDADGNYVFSHETTAEAHTKCYAKFVNAVTKQEACIVIDNTNTRKSEYAHYVQYAKSMGYLIREMVIGVISDERAMDEYMERGKHGVPKETMLRMALRFEV